MKEKASSGIRLRITFIIAGILLVGYITTLLILNYVSQVNLGKLGIERLRSDIENRANAFSYFLSERKNDLRNLASNRAILSFFENRALGMTMEYGLKINLLFIKNTFDQYLADRRFDGYSIFDRFILVDKDGSIIVDTGQTTEAHEKYINYILTPHKAEPSIFMFKKGAQLQTLISMPYLFKGEYSGQIVGCVSERIIRDIIGKQNSNHRLSLYLLSSDEIVPVYESQSLKISEIKIPDPFKLKENRIYKLDNINGDFKIISGRFSIKNTPLSLFFVGHQSDIYGIISPWHLPLAMVILGVLLLVGVYIAYRINTHRTILRARLDEASKRQKEIEEKNIQLNREIDNRKRVEEELRGAQEELENKVKERTKELLEINVALRQEIEQRKRAEEKIKESEARYRILIENSPLGISIIDHDGNYRYINSKFSELFGYTLDDIKTGRDFFKLVFPEESEQKRAISSWFKAVEVLKNSKIYDDIYDITSRDGTKKHVHFIVGNLDKDHYVAIYEDLTEKKRLEQQFRHAQKMETIGTLAGGIAHDFNNLLQPILGYTEVLLMDKEKDDPDHEKLINIKVSVEKAGNLIKQILTFSRRVETQKKPINLNHEVREIERLLRRTIPKEIKIELHLSDDLKLINADATQIEQVLMNISVNAKDAMPLGGSLTFKTTNIILDEEFCKKNIGAKPGEYVLLSISDTGVGIDPETLEHIFEPFYTTKEKGKGTGLGLSTVYGIVKGHDGYISCESAPNVGTTFKIYLPAIKTISDNEINTHISEKVLPGGSETILIVDDEYHILRMGEEALKRFGYRVFTAKSGEEAIKLLMKDGLHPDLIILDLSMPDMGGEKCMERILEWNPHQKILISSGYLSNGNINNIIKKGAVGFLGKPYRIKNLLEKVREVLD